jgi:hypothetical protein
MFAIEGVFRRRLPKRTGLLRRKPGAQPNSELLDALDSADAGRKIWAEQTAVRCSGQRILPDRGLATSEQ